MTQYCLSTTVLSDAAAIAELSAFQTTSRCFLASIDETIWAPRVVVLREANRIVGIVFAKERIFAGLPTGIIFADSTLDSMVIAESAMHEVVFQECIEALIRRPGTRALRLLVSADGYERRILAQISPALTASQTSVEHHCVLRLPACYDIFLQGLGYRTRRNFRHYRRVSASERTFVEVVPFADFKAASARLMKEGGVGTSAQGVARALKVLAAAEHPVLAGLKDADGNYVSIIGGWREEGRIIVFFQMNSDLKHPEASLSIVLRGHFIEAAIAHGVNKVIFWAGAGGALARYTESMPTVAVYLDKPSIFWRSLRHVVESGRSLLPVRLRDLAEWVVPPNEKAT